MTLSVDTDDRPRLLDLFCKEGGAAKGYADAGFNVVGVDIEPQPRYPFKVYCNDALQALDNLRQWQGAGGWRVDAIHASPPCQGYSRARVLNNRDHTRLIAATRDALERTGLPYVIENVADARDALIDPVELCGGMFEMRTYRHRLFETNWPLAAPLHPPHHLRKAKMGRPAKDDEMLVLVGNFPQIALAREVMEMPWASRDGIREAVPPAYTRHIGQQLMAHINVEEIAA